MGPKPYHIAVNTRFLLHNQLEGIGLFTYESLKRIVSAHPECTFYFLFDRPFHPSFIFAENVKPVVLFPPARHPFLWYWWFEWSVACWLNRHKPDLFLSTDCYASLRTCVPQVTVIHDLAFEHFAEHVPAITLAYYRYFLPRFARKAARIATVSEYSKNDIANRYQVNPASIDVVYNGAKEVYKPLSEEAKHHTRQQYAGGQPYFIYVGSIHPRKNIKNILLAFERFKHQSGLLHQLLLVGRKAWQFSEVEETHAQMQFREHVKFLGHISPESLGAIMASAEAMVYVSLFEGFGIPIIEAMQCDVPVITSNTTSMPEAAGDAAILVNPLEVEKIADAMQQIATDVTLRRNLIERGRLQIQKFSWDKTAGALWNCCEKVLINNANKNI